MYPDIRTGSGFDVHKLVEGRKLILCGVDIPHNVGLLGHSDADVALHAVADALLGAAAAGDIGKHFPDNAPEYKGADSRVLLRRVVSLLENLGFQPCNIDITIIAQAPKIAPYIEQMRMNVASDLGLPMSRVSVKATTTEGLGYTGRKEGIAAMAAALICAK